MNETAEQMYLGKETNIRYGGGAMNDPQIGNQYVCEKCGHGPFDPRHAKVLLEHETMSDPGESVICCDFADLATRCPQCRTYHVRKWRQSDEDQSRLKRVRVSMRTLMTYLFQQVNLPRYIELPELQLPEGYRIVRVGCPSDGSHTIEVTVQHSSFPALRVGEIPPEFMDGKVMWRVHELKQTDDPTPQIVERKSYVPLGGDVEVTSELKAAIKEQMDRMKMRGWASTVIGPAGLTLAEEQEIERRVNERVAKMMTDKSLDVAASVLRNDWNDKPTLVDGTQPWIPAINERVYRKGSTVAMGPLRIALIKLPLVQCLQEQTGRLYEFQLHQLLRESEVMEHEKLSDPAEHVLCGADSLN